MSRKFHADGTPPENNSIFVFGSNLSGIHGGGAASAAHKLYGAKWGVAVGRTGHSYAIPTVRQHINGPIDLPTIDSYVQQFLHHSATHPEDSFFVTRIGCGLAGYKDRDIAPMFKDAPLNCSLPETWRKYVEQRGEA